MKQIIENITRDWVSYAYDIRAQTIDGVKKVKFIDIETRASTWVSSNIGKGATYYNLGPIRAGLDYAIISARGKVIADTGGNYNYLFNNCDTFANKLYKDIAI